MVKERVSKLRAWMSTEGVHAFIVTSEDAHQSEYVADCDKRREYVSGFTGSAGTAVIMQDQAWLWTDGRYLQQAEQQLDADVWKVMNSRPKLPVDLLCSSLPPSSSVAVDPWLLPLSTARTVESKLSAAGHTLVALKSNPVDALWTDRPPAPSQGAFVHPLELAGQSVTDKLAAVRAEVALAGAHAIVVSALDEVAWLLNIRGADIPYNPVVLSYALVTESAVSWYVEESKVTLEVKAHLEADKVNIRPYGALPADIAALRAASAAVLIDPVKCSWAIYRELSLQGHKPLTVIEKMSPITNLKSIKNSAELDGFRRAHLKDAVAVCTFLLWLEKAAAEGEALDEVSVATKLEGLRRKQEGFVSLSFETISGYGPNGAIIHYSPQPGACGKLGTDALYLVDSGGQYKEGTTDITRTVHLGTPTEHERQCFTRVLKGHIALSNCVFPAGTTGHMLDLLARTPLWAAGLDYRHGTGHGVGAFLCVHEGPHLISYYARDPDPPIKAGMTSSIEPGYYEDGKFGIRIENVAIVKQAQTEHKFQDTEFLCFEPIALVPIQAKLIDLSLLLPDEVRWVDDYHQTVWDKVSPLLGGEELEWLKANTRPLVFQVYGEDAMDSA